MGVLERDAGIFRNKCSYFFFRGKIALKFLRKVCTLCITEKIVSVHGKGPFLNICSAFFQRKGNKSTAVLQSF